METKNGQIRYQKSSESVYVDKKDASVVHKRDHATFVDHVDSTLLTTDREGSRLARVRLASTRIPQIGDKFASRHGQKGVIGIIFNEWVSTSTSKM